MRRQFSLTSSIYAIGYKDTTCLRVNWVNVIIFLFLDIFIIIIIKCVNNWEFDTIQKNVDGQMVRVEQSWISYSSMEFMC